MFNRIVVPLDGTRFAEAALAPARELARAFDSRIMVIRALPTGLPIATAARDEQAEFERLDEADDYLHGIVDTLRAQGYKADLLVHIAEPGAGIARAAALDHADVIMMSTHLRWKVDPMGGPSVTLRVLARSRTPIFAWRVAGAVEPEGGPDVAERPPLLARVESPIVVPLDGSPFAEQALEAAETLARTFGLYLVLVRAVEPLTLEGEERDAAAYLERVRAELEQRNVRAATTVRRGTPLSVIDRVWREYDGGPIVIASHGRGGLTGTFLGSVAAQLLEEVESPVLVIRPHEEAADAGAVTPPTILYHTYPGQPG
jgi:nucleotide-binding universal stress UspA family protein